MSGKEQLRVSRLDLDVVGSQADFSQEAAFLEAKTGKIYFSPVYLREESEPYMTLAKAGSGVLAGVSVAEVNLKFIWEVASQIKIGRAGYAYAVDSRGQLIAHPDISLVLRKTELSSLPQIQAVHAGPPGPDERRVGATIARDREGRQVLTAYATIVPLGSSVLAEQPLGEAFAPVYGAHAPHRRALDGRPSPVNHGEHGPGAEDGDANPEVAGRCGADLASPRSSWRCMSGASG